jgi:hypothetical protein
MVEPTFAGMKWDPSLDKLDQLVDYPRSPSGHPLLIDAFSEAGMSRLVVDVIAGIQAVGKATGSETQANEMAKLLREGCIGW